MSYLAFHSPDATVHLTGPEVHRIMGLAHDALTGELALPPYQPLRAELGLPPAHSRFFASEILMMMGDGQARHLQGRDVYLFDVSLNVLYGHQPAAGIQCWLFDHALTHGWVAEADRQAMAAEMQAALDAGAARPRMADRHTPALVVGELSLPAGDRGGWEEVMSFLCGGAGDVVTSLSMGNTFPGYRLARDAGTWQPATIGSEPEDEDELDALWDQLSSADQWELCTRALRTRPHLQWHPDGASYVFGDFTLHPDHGLVAARSGKLTV